MYTEKIERIQRFKLALRMGIPIFLLTGVLLFSLLSQYLEHIPGSFIIIIVGILAISVYFQFYLIYQGFNEGITDFITHTFTPSYLKKLFKQRKKKLTQTLILFSIDNISDINERFGIKNGDKLLYDTSKLIDAFFQEKGIKNLILSYYKGGNFIILLDGEQSDNRLLFDLFSSKVAYSKIEGIEIKSSGAIIDTKVNDDFEKLIDRLFELQIESQKRQKIILNDEVNLNELENSILKALDHKNLSIMAQEVESKKSKILDVSVKLIDENQKLIHQKRFLPIITRLGLRARYELLKIEFIIEETKKYPEYSCVMSIAAEVLRDYQFQTQVESLVSGIKECRLVFMLEEKEYYSNIKHFDYILQNYRDLGIRIALDGLGNNHTTQLYMKDLHVDMVRFDGSYGKKIEDKRYQNMLEGLNLMAQKMGLYTWVRLIKDETSATIAKEMGIDMISGNYLAKIASIETIAKKEEV